MDAGAARFRRGDIITVLEDLPRGWAVCPRARVRGTRADMSKGTCGRVDEVTPRGMVYLVENDHAIFPDEYSKIQVWPLPGAMGHGAKWCYQKLYQIVV